MKDRMSGVKKRRLCSEYRKARSRQAARSRREQEGTLFAELQRVLPMPLAVTAHLDKASVIRLALSYLRVRALLGVPDPQCAQEGAQGTAAAPGRESDRTSLVETVLDSAFEGFLLLLSGNGQVLYATEAIGMYTGLRQVDLIGQSLYDFMHPCDQQEAREILSSKSGIEGCQRYDLLFRMRSTLTPQKRNVNLKSATWKVIHCTGVKRPPGATGPGCLLLLLCRVLPASVSTAWECNLNARAFLSKHSPDMRFTYCQPRVFQLTGYTETELLGHSVYQYYHASDCQHVRKAHLSLLSKGQTSTGKYRLLVKHGGYVWVETVATVVYNSRTGQLQSIVCVNYILSEVEQSEEIFSLEQMECLLKPISSSPAPGPPLLLQGAALLAELSQQAAVPSNPCGNATPVESALTQEYEDHTGDTAEKASFIFHATGESSTDVLQTETLLEWSTEAYMQATPQDLETLAPYIPMDGEDFLLFPDSDMEGFEVEGQGLVHALPFSFPNLDTRGPAPHLPHLTDPWSTPTPPMTPHAPSGYYSTCGPNHTLMRESGGDSGPGCSLRTEQEWWRALETYRANIPLSPQPHSQCRPPSWPPEHIANPRKRPKASDICYSTNYASCWWSPDGLVCRCGPVPWAPGHTEFSNHSRDQHHPVRDKHRTVLVRRASALPVLSRRECEVNAPLDPSSCLLRGSEILSVLDQATSRLPP